MRTFAFFCFLAAPLAASAATTIKSTRLFPYPLKVDTLKNGLTLVRVPFPSKGLVAYYSAVRVGSRNEVEADHTGFAHFFEHMMFKGTPTHPDNTRDRLLAALGFDDNAFTSDDMTIFHSFGPSSGLNRLIELEADRFQHLTYSEPSFQTEAKAVLGEYNKGHSNPDQQIEETLAATAFARHTYRHTTIGFEADIKKMLEYYQYSKEFFRRWYTPDNVMIFVVGDFEDGPLMQAIHAAYDGWTGTSAKVAIPTEPPQEAARAAHIDWAGPTLPRHIDAWHVPAASLVTMDAATAEVLAPYLAGPTSPLYRTLVLDRQMCESVTASYFDHRDPWLFTMEATLKDEKFRPEVKTALDGAVSELARGNLDAKRLEDIKSNLRYGLSMELETADQVGEQLAVTAAVFGKPDALELHYQNITKVTSKELVAFAKKYLVDTNRTVVVLTAKAEAAGHAEGGR